MFLLWYVCRVARDAEMMRSGLGASRFSTDLPSRNAKNVRKVQRRKSVAAAPTAHIQPPNTISLSNIATVALFALSDRSQYHMLISYVYMDAYVLDAALA